MRIFAISDIHSRQNLNTDIKEKLSDVDLVVIAGDLTNFGHADEAESIVQNIRLYNNNILAVPGNCDYPDINNELINMGVNLHGITRTIDNIALYGLGGSSRTPFNTPQENKESEITTLLESFQKDPSLPYHIFVSHSPPAMTKLDRTFLGIHAGSKAIKKFISKFQPDIVICGHIHEARGVDKIGSSIMINPGPFPKHYAIINLLENITYELH